MSNSVNRPDPDLYIVQVCSEAQIRDQNMMLLSAKNAGYNATALTNATDWVQTDLTNKAGNVNQNKSDDGDRTVAENAYNQANTTDKQITDNFSARIQTVQQDISNWGTSNKDDTDFFQTITGLWSSLNANIEALMGG